MSNEKKPTLGFVITVIVVVVLLVPALYVVSAGPAVFLFGMGAISEETLAIAYAPLFFVLDHIPERVADRFQDYLGWWEALGEAAVV